MWLRQTYLDNLLPQDNFLCIWKISCAMKYNTGGRALGEIMGYPKTPPAAAIHGPLAYFLFIFWPSLFLDLVDVLSYYLKSQWMCEHSKKVHYEKVDPHQMLNLPVPWSWTHQPSGLQEINLSAVSMHWDWCKEWAWGWEWEVWQNSQHRYFLVASPKGNIEVHLRTSLEIGTRSVNPGDYAQWAMTSESERRDPSCHI